MSDLQCPATLLVLRHGEAVYGDPDRLDDGAGGRLTSRGRDQAAALADTLVGRRVAKVYTSPLGRAHETGQVLAERLGVGLEALPGLREFEIGELDAQPASDAWPQVDDTFSAWLDGDLHAAFPGGEDGQGVLARVREALGEIADLHRGETVVVVSHGGAISLTLPRLAANLPDDFASGRSFDNCGVVEVTADADGWWVVSWCGTEL